MRRKVVAGMLTFAMFGMSLSSFSPTQVCAADDLGKVEVHVSAKEGGYDQTLPDLQFEKADTAQSSGYVKVYPDEKRQTFLGVGGAMTESAAYNLQKLSIFWREWCEVFCFAFDDWLSRFFDQILQL